MLAVVLGTVGRLIGTWADAASEPATGLFPIVLSVGAAAPAGAEVADDSLVLPSLEVEEVAVADDPGLAPAAVEVKRDGMEEVRSLSVGQDVPFCCWACEVLAVRTSTSSTSP